MNLGQEFPNSSFQMNKHERLKSRRYFNQLNFNVRNLSHFNGAIVAENILDNKSPAHITKIHKNRKRKRQKLFECDSYRITDSRKGTEMDSSSHIHNGTATPTKHKKTAKTGISPEVLQNNVTGSSQTSFHTRKHKKRKKKKHKASPINNSYAEDIQNNRASNIDMFKVHRNSVEIKQIYSENKSNKINKIYTENRCQKSNGDTYKKHKNYKKKQKNYSFTHSEVSFYSPDINAETYPSALISSSPKDSSNYHNNVNDTQICPQDINNKQKKKKNGFSGKYNVRLIPNNRTENLTNESYCDNQMNSNVNEKEDSDLFYFDISGNKDQTEQVTGNIVTEDGLKMFRNERCVDNDVGYNLNNFSNISSPKNKEKKISTNHNYNTKLCRLTTSEKKQSSMDNNKTLKSNLYNECDSSVEISGGHMETEDVLPINKQEGVAENLHKKKQKKNKHVEYLIDHKSQESPKAYRNTNTITKKSHRSEQSELKNNHQTSQASEVDSNISESDCEIAIITNGVTSSRRKNKSNELLGNETETSTKTKENSETTCSTVGKPKNQKVNINMENNNRSTTKSNKIIFIDEDSASESECEIVDFGNPSPEKKDKHVEILDFNDKSKKKHRTKPLRNNRKSTLRNENFSNNLQYTSNGESDSSNSSREKNQSINLSLENRGGVQNADSCNTRKRRNENRDISITISDSECESVHFDQSASKIKEKHKKTTGNNNEQENIPEDIKTFKESLLNSFLEILRESYKENSNKRNETCSISHSIKKKKRKRQVDCIKETNINKEDDNGNENNDFIQTLNAEKQNVDNVNNKNANASTSVTISDSECEIIEVSNKKKRKHKTINMESDSENNSHKRKRKKKAVQDDEISIQEILNNSIQHDLSEDLSVTEGCETVKAKKKKVKGSNNKKIENDNNSKINKTKSKSIKPEQCLETLENSSKHLSVNLQDDEISIQEILNNPIQHDLIENLSVTEGNETVKAKKKKVKGSNNNKIENDNNSKINKTKLKSVKPEEYLETLDNSSKHLSMNGMESTVELNISEDGEKEYDQSKTPIIDMESSEDAEQNEDIEKLQNLFIRFPYSVPPLHAMATRTTTATKEQLKEIKNMNIPIKTGPFSKEEDEKIIENWKRLCKVYDLRLNPSVFISFPRRVQHETKMNILRYIAHGMDNRMLHRVYIRFKHLLQKERFKSGSFTPEEDKIILDYMENTTSTCPYRDLSEVLNRTRISIEKRHDLLTSSDNKMNYWTVEMVDKFVKALMKVTKCERLKDLKNRTITSKEWRKLSKKLNHIPTIKLQRAWKITIYPRLFSEKVDLQNMKKEIIQILYDRNETDWRTIDWKEISKNFKGFTVDKIYMMFKHLIYFHLPKEKQSNLKECLDFLKNKLLKYHKIPSTHKFKKYVVKDGSITYEDADSETV